jgi:hypothetical protein
MKPEREQRNMARGNKKLGTRRNVNEKENDIKQKRHMKEISEKKEMVQTTITPTRHTKHGTHIMHNSCCRFYECYVIFEVNICVMLTSITGQRISLSSYEINHNVLISKVLVFTRFFIMSSVCDNAREGSNNFIQDS